jgi:hypothetical protein
MDVTLPATFTVIKYSCLLLKSSNFIVLKSEDFNLELLKVAL